jgi:thioredoxin reductase
LIYDITIIGAGLAGLSAARIAEEKGVEKVLLVEYQSSNGGFTLPYQNTPEFASEKQAVEKAVLLKYPVWLRSTVIGFFPDADNGHTLFVQTPEGTEKVSSRRVLIASGALEKPKEAHKIPGGRPSGIMTPYMAAEMLQRGYRLGSQVALFDTGRIARSTAVLLKQSAHNVHVFDQEELVYVQGTSKLEKIRVEHTGSGDVRDFACDTLLYCRGRYAGTFFMKELGVDRDDEMALVVDVNGQTGIRGVYAAGSCTIRGDANHGNSVEQGETVMREMLS